VCVPTHAVTRPSTCQPIATFSEVASAWKSSSMKSAFSRRSAISASASENGDRAASTKTVPSRLVTASRAPFFSTTVDPRPGLPFG
jgi:hypothetical protein